ncbi:hypothetical protein DMC30DRAFT_423807 [Rhodotorula diobovata]|uniref:F-box domain-containing protein n=1 Tax=Rhodotorula diobovata TaxID=5288 RepID=A0A5C5FSQ9_9BASI|nr:hypothetical protein DMC30DRAFT_423807 [Rhodotorula diobovata]
MARSTLRRDATHKRKHDLSDDDDDLDDLELENWLLRLASEDSSDEAPSEAPKPKRRSVGSGARGTKGVLEGILDLPLDVLINVCSHLDLATVCHLSRLSRRFFRFLRGNSSLSYIWEWAREESGLPELTAPGLTPVQYAHLLFGKHCQNCGKATTKIDYILRVCVCQKCSKDLVWDDRERHTTLCRDFEFCPCSEREGSGRSRNHGEYLVEDLKFRGFIERFYDGADSSDLITIKPGHGFDGDAIIAWQLQRLEEKEEEREAQRVRRREAIEVRFQERGWQPRNFQSIEWRTHSLVNIAKDINDSVWQSIHEPLEAFLAAQEDQRNAEYMRARSDERRNECVTEHDLLLKDKALAKKLGLYPLPPWADFCELEAVKKLWQIATIDDAYAEEYPSIVTDAGAIADELSTLKTVFKAALLPKVVEILRDIEKASASTEGAHRLELLPEPEDGDDFTLEQEDDILARASSAISCRACSFIDVFPRILAHECASYSSRHGAASHTIAEYKVREKVARAVLAIADKAGLEPEASYDAFDELGSTMSCACDLPESMAVPWHNMIYHLTTFHDSPLRSSDIQVVVESEQEAMERVFEKHKKRVRWAGVDSADM